MLIYIIFVLLHLKNSGLLLSVPNIDIIITKQYGNCK